MTASGFDIASRRLLVAAALCAGAAASTGGCSHDADVAKTKPPPVELQWKDEPLKGAAGGVATPVTVKEGFIPLVYLNEQPQVVQVVDRTANKVLGQADVPARTLVRVDERMGVIAGKEAVFIGPLDKTHHYAILVVPQGQAVVRTGQYQPVAPPRLDQKGAATDAPPNEDLTDVGKDQVK
jgi:hypothetical protein